MKNVTQPFWMIQQMFQSCLELVDFNVDRNIHGISFTWDFPCWLISVEQTNLKLWTPPPKCWASPCHHHDSHMCSWLLCQSWSLAPGSHAIKFKFKFQTWTWHRTYHWFRKPDSDSKSTMVMVFFEFDFLSLARLLPTLNVLWSKSKSDSSSLGLVVLVPIEMLSISWWF
jgi:hypothetical protein